MTAIRYVRGTLPGLPGEHDIAVLDGDTHISRWVEESRRLDHDQNALPRIGKLIGPESVVYDVGAFVGDHTCYYASKARQVVAWEVFRDAFACLKHNASHYPNAVCSNVAVGDGYGFLPTNQCEDERNKGARWLYSTFGEDDGDAIHDVRIDGAVGRCMLDPPTLIKLDIEGWEVRALRGAERTIRERRPIIVCEVNRGALERAGTSPEELRALLTGYGYEMRDLFTEELWQPGDQRAQFDVVGKPRTA